MEKNIFTDEALRVLDEEIKKFTEELKSEAINEALRYRGEPIEVTANDIKKARNKFIKKENSLLPSTELLLNLYKAIGILSIIFGFFYSNLDYIQSLLLDSDSKTRIGTLSVISGIILILLSYLLKQYINVFFIKRSRRKSSYISIKNELTNIEEPNDVNRIQCQEKVSDDKDKLDLLAKISPKSLILESWIMIEETINKLFLRNLSNSEKFQSSNPLKVMEYLLDKKYIDYNMFRKLNTMRALRNKIVHSSRDTDISYEEAKDYQHLAESLIKKLYMANPSKKVYISCTSWENAKLYKDLILAWNSEGKFFDIVNSTLELNLLEENVLKDTIKENIKNADVVLCLVTSDFINKFTKYEIELAYSLNKTVIAVRINYLGNVDSILEENRVRWVNSLNKDSLIEALYQ